MPNLLAQSPSWIRGMYDHAWAAMQQLERQVRCLPPALLDSLLECEGGYVAIVSGTSHYVPGAAVVRQRQVQNVAYVAVEDLAGDTEQPLHVIGHLIDHHLGCGGAPDGPWLSEGGGLRPAWQAAGERLVRLFPLGYGLDEVALSSPRNYFAQSLAIYCRDRQRLNVADPQIDKWFRSTLWQAGFWTR
ncbi:MAG: hypothetical protein PVI09_12510 [Anaerolineae bacterium]